ncbi:MAG: DMT family transporter [Thermovirgaceae bacterium]|nr:DMT family transporter [Thermovirgaceae bacterium]
MLATQWSGYTLAFLAAVSWAIAPILYRRGIDHVSYAGLGAVRCAGYIATTALFLLFTMGPGAFTPPDFRILASIVACSLIWIVLGDFFYFSALHKLGVSICVPITSAYPLLVVPASWIFLGERVSPMVFVAAALIVAGLILLSPSGGNEEGRRQIRSGLVAAFLAMACWTFGILTNKLLLQMIPVPQLEWWRAVSVTIGSWAMFLMVDRAKGLGKISLRAFVEMGIAGALGLAVGNLLFTYSLSFTPVDIVACIASVRPFLSAVFATLVLRERLTPRIAGGIILVVGGVIAITL